MTNIKKILVVILITIMYVVVTASAYLAFPPRVAIPGSLPIPETTKEICPPPPPYTKNGEVYASTGICEVEIIPAKPAIPLILGEPISLSAAGIILFATSGYIAALIFILTRKKKT